MNVFKETEFFIALTKSSSWYLLRICIRNCPSWDKQLLFPKECVEQENENGSSFTITTVLSFISVYPKTTGIPHYKTMSSWSSFKLWDHITCIINEITFVCIECVIYETHAGKYSTSYFCTLDKYKLTQDNKFGLETETPIYHNICWSYSPMGELNLACSWNEVSALLILNPAC